MALISDIQTPPTGSDFEGGPRVPGEATKKPQNHLCPFWHYAGHVLMGRIAPALRTYKRTPIYLRCHVFSFPF